MDSAIALDSDVDGLSQSIKSKDDLFLNEIKYEHTSEVTDLVNQIEDSLNIKDSIKGHDLNNFSSQGFKDSITAFNDSNNIIQISDNPIEDILTNSEDVTNSTIEHSANESYLEIEDININNKSTKLSDFLDIVANVENNIIIEADFCNDVNANISENSKEIDTEINNISGASDKIRKNSKEINTEMIDISIVSENILVDKDNNTQVDIIISDNEEIFKNRNIGENILGTDKSNIINNDDSNVIEKPQLEDHEYDDYDVENDEDYEDATENSGSFEDYSENSQYSDEEDYTEEEEIVSKEPSKRVRSDSLNSSESKNAQEILETDEKSVSLDGILDSIDREAGNKDEDTVYDGDQAPRQGGDGEEEGETKKKVDDDDDKENPAYIPRKGGFYQHDLRTMEEKDKKAETSEQDKKLWIGDSSKWSHDLFRKDQPKTKSRTEIIAKYGFDIRAMDHCPTNEEIHKFNNEKREKDKRPSAPTMGDFLPSRNKNIGRGRGKLVRDSESNPSVKLHPPNDILEKSNKENENNNSQDNDAFSNRDDFKRTRGGRGSRGIKNDRREYTRTGRPELDEAQRNKHSHVDKLNVNNSNTRTYNSDFLSNKSEKSLSNTQVLNLETVNYRDFYRERNKNRRGYQANEKIDADNKDSTRYQEKRDKEPIQQRRENLNKNERNDSYRGSRSFREIPSNAHNDKVTNDQQKFVRNVDKQDGHGMSSIREDHKQTNIKLENKYSNINEERQRPNNLGNSRSHNQNSAREEQNRHLDNTHDFDRRENYRNRGDNRYQGNNFYQEKSNQDVREGYYNKHYGNQDEANYPRQYTNSRYSDDKNIESKKFGDSKVYGEIRDKRVERSYHTPTESNLNYHSNKDHYREDKNSRDNYEKSQPELQYRSNYQDREEMGNKYERNYEGGNNDGNKRLSLEIVNSNIPNGEYISRVPNAYYNREEGIYTIQTNDEFTHEPPSFVPPVTSSFSTRPLAQNIKNKSLTDINKDTNKGWAGGEFTPGWRVQPSQEDGEYKMAEESTQGGAKPKRYSSLRNQRIGMDATNQPPGQEFQSQDQSYSSQQTRPVGDFQPKEFLPNQEYKPRQVTVNDYQQHIQEFQPQEFQHKQRREFAPREFSQQGQEYSQQMGEYAQPQIVHYISNSDGNANAHQHFGQTPMRYNYYGQARPTFNFPPPPQITHPGVPPQIMGPRPSAQHHQFSDHMEPVQQIYEIPGQPALVPPQQFMHQQPMIKLPPGSIVQYPPLYRVQGDMNASQMDIHRSQHGVYYNVPNQGTINQVASQQQLNRQKVAIPIVNPQDTND